MRVARRRVMARGTPSNSVLTMVVFLYILAFCYFSFDQEQIGACAENSEATTLGAQPKGFQAT